MLIDAGHGGSDPGAVSNGVREKDIALAYAMNLGQIAKDAGRTVRYTRTKDAFLDLNRRARVVKPGEILISCHVNGATSAAAKGASVWYHQGCERSYKLAVEILEHILATGLFSQYSTGVICDIPRYRTGFAMLREAAEIKARAAVIVEPGFISNARDRAVLVVPKNRIILAEAIHNGLTDYLNNG